MHVDNRTSVDLKAERRKSEEVNGEVGKNTAKWEGIY